MVLAEKKKTWWGCMLRIALELLECGELVSRLEPRLDRQPASPVVIDKVPVGWSWESDEPTSTKTRIAIAVVKELMDLTS
jgi:hypothetical protein